MILKWLQLVTPGSQAQAAKASDDDERRTRHESKLKDIAHEVLSKRAAEDCKTLEALSRYGTSHIQHKRFKAKVRKKVWDVVAQDFGEAPPDMIEEITERIADVAEADPFYKKMFNKD